MSMHNDIIQRMPLALVEIPPCQWWCPAILDIPRVLRAIAKRRHLLGPQNMRPLVLGFTSCNQLNEYTQVKIHEVTTVAFLPTAGVFGNFGGAYLLEFVRSETWVTERSGDMGYTFRPEGGGEEDAMEGDFCDGRTNALCDPA